MKTLDSVQIIKESVTCNDVAHAFGIDVDQHGRCACPFHHGKDRNLKLYPGNRGYYCFVCHNSGDVISFVEQLTGLGFTGSVNWIRDHFGLTIPDEMLELSESKRGKRDDVETLRRELFMIEDLQAKLFGRVMADGRADLIPECNRTQDRIEAMLNSFKRIEKS